MFKIFSVILVSILSMGVLAETKKESANDTIPFVTYQNRITYYSYPIANSSLSSPISSGYFAQWSNSSIKGMKTSTAATVVEQETTTSHIPTAEVKNLVERVRESVCSSVGDADVRVWISIDASGKLLGVGASTQSGLEVTFHCKARTG